MKGITRIIAFIFLLSVLALPFTAFATSPQDLSIAVMWTDGSGTVNYSNPAVPVSAAPDENRFWITLPWGAPTAGFSLVISDLTGQLTSFQPNNGDPLDCAVDFRGSLNSPSVEIQAFNALDELQGVYYLYISTENAPQVAFTPTEAPTEAPAAVTAQVVVHYVDEYGNFLMYDMIYTFDAGVHQIEAPAVDRYTVSEQVVSVSVDAYGANPSEVTFVYSRIPYTGDVTIHYRNENGEALLPDAVQTLSEGAQTVYAPSIDGYEPGVPAYAEVYVSAQGADPAEVTFTYQREVQPVTVIAHYVDDLGQTIAPDTAQTFEKGSHIISPIADISSADYILQEPSAYSLYVALDTLSVSEVTFTYSRAVKPATVTIHYTDAFGNPVADDDWQTLDGGGSVVFAQPRNLLTGYVLREGDMNFQSVTVDADGAHPDTITFIYEYQAPAPVILSVRYVDAESGFDVATAQTVEAPANAVTPVSAQPYDLLDYYTLVSEPTVYVSVDAAGNSDTAEVLFLYQYVAPTEVPTEVPTAEPTEAPTPEPTEAPTEVPTAEPTAEPTEEPTAEPTEVPTAEPTEAPTEVPTEAPTAEPTDAPTEVPTEVPTEEPASEPTAAPAPAVVSVLYLDEEGNPVASGVQVLCAYGDTRIIADPFDLQPGYELTGEDSIIIHVDENGASPAEAVFVYRAVSDNPAPKVALVNVKYLNPNEEVFYSYPVTCAEGQENPVSVDWSYVDSSLGYQLVSDATVYVTVDSSGAASPSEVIFRFHGEAVAYVRIRYIDAETGREVATSRMETCYVGANIIDARPLDLEDGYTPFGETSASAFLTQDGQLTPEEIVFQYIRQATPTPTPALPAYDTPMDAYFYPTGTEVRVRSTPTTADNNIIGTVNNSNLGHALGRVTTSDNKIWYAVEINGMVGYMNESVIRFLTDAELAAQFNYTLPPTAEPTAEPTEVPDGAIIDRWGTTVSSVNFRKSPDRSGSSRISELKKNTRVWIYSSQTVNGEKWYSVRVNGTDGYLMADYVQIATEAESAEIQAKLASPMPTQQPPATATPEPTPVPTAEPTEIPTEAPLEIVTQAPTEIPTDVPTETPTPYRGYALTTGQAALRTGVSQTDDTILEMLPDQSLLIVNSPTYVDSVAWYSVQSVSSGNWGFILQSSLIPITAEEARPYLERIQSTPSPVPTQVPEQISGYAMTLGDGVPMRSYPDTNGEILTLLPYLAVAEVRGQQYVGGDSWHLVLYNGLWGYIRQDQLRMMSEDEALVYQQSQLAGTAAPTTAPTPEPATQDSLSSYGHVVSASGRVNLRSEPTTKNSNAIKLLDNYAFALVLGSVTNEEGTWYYISQKGTEGYIRGDYFHVLTLGELGEFLQSAEYINANSNDTSTAASSSEIQSVEDYNQNVWQNPALNVTYEPFNPYTTPTPDPERLATATPVPSPTPSPTPEIAPVGPLTNVTPEPNTSEGSSPLPWIMVGIAAVCGAAAYGVYVHREAEQRRHDMWEQQARQMRANSVQRPRMRQAQNNPAQAPVRPVYPDQNGAPFMPAQGGAPQPGPVRKEAPVTGGTNIYRVQPAAEAQKPMAGGQNDQPVRMDAAAGQQPPKQEARNYQTAWENQAYQNRNPEEPVYRSARENQLYQAQIQDVKTTYQPPRENQAYQPQTQDAKAYQPPRENQAYQPQQAQDVKAYQPLNQEMLADQSEAEGGTRKFQLPRRDEGQEENRVQETRNYQPVRPSVSVRVDDLPEDGQTPAPQNPQMNAEAPAPVSASRLNLNIKTATLDLEDLPPEPEHPAPRRRRTERNKALYDQNNSES